MKHSAWIRWLIPAGFVGLAVFFYRAVVGYDFSGLVCLAIAGVISGYYGIFALQKKFPHLGKILLRGVTVLLFCGLLVVGITGGLIYAAGQRDTAPACKYVLVLGCPAQEDGPSVTLEERLQTACAYLQAHPQTVCIVSGGKGESEAISEAQCMYTWLVCQGIAPERILLEEQATSTWENIVFSLALLEAQDGTRPGTLGIISSEYHIYRAQMYATACGIKTYGIPATTQNLPLRINNYLREIAGVWHYILLGG